MPSIKPLNISAQLAHKARGNPPSTLANSAISNCFPGLEFDFRNIWKLIFENVELHEAGQDSDGHIVLHVVPGSSAQTAGLKAGDRLLRVDGRGVDVTFTRPSGQATGQIALEFSAALTHILSKSGEMIQCVFEKSDNQQLTIELRLKQLIDGIAISEELAEPGAMTQGLCSPWQADYRECGCFYWAASRPDFVNVENNGGQAAGQDWMQNDKSAGADYTPDPRGGGFSPDHVSYDDLYREWEAKLKFVIDGKTEE